MTISQALVHARKQKEIRGRLTRESVQMLRNTILTEGKIRVEIGRDLPLPGEAEVVDDVARETMREIIRTLGGGGHFVRVQCRYTRDTPNKPDKRLGMPYWITGKLSCPGTVKGEKDPEEQRRMHRRNGTIPLWGCDTPRQTGDPESRWRSPKLGAVSAISINKRVIPVEFVRPNGEKVELFWRDAPVRQTV